MALGNRLVKVLALNLGNLELERRGLARAVSTGKSASAPGGAAVDLAQVGELAKALCVAQGYVDDAVVGKSGHGGDGGALLAATGRGSRDEETTKLAPEGAALPLGAGMVPEGLDLGGEVSVTGGY